MKTDLDIFIHNLEENSRFLDEKKYSQHGSTSVYEHSIHVACISLRIAQKLPFQVDTDCLLRGALLHDYFLYDWHEKDKSHRLHGFFHPRKALHNAQEDFSLNKIEENIILRHMFPLTPIPPIYREAWIVCLADKYCALKETFSARFSIKKQKQTNFKSTQNACMHDKYHLL